MENIKLIRNGIALLGFLSPIILLFGIVAAGLSIKSLANKWNDPQVYDENTKKSYPQIIGDEFIGIGMIAGLIPTWLLPMFVCLIWYTIQPSFLNFFEFIHSELFLISGLFILAVFLGITIGIRLKNRSSKESTQA